MKRAAMEKTVPATGVLVPPPTAVEELRQAKRHSDKRQYAAKHAILRRLMEQHPHDFIIDTPNGAMVGITHVPTKFRLHMPMEAIPTAVRNQSQPLRPGNKVAAAAVLTPGGIKLAQLRIDIVDSPENARLGMMHLPALPPDRGMLFKRAESFWMPNVRFDLDILFLTKQGDVLDIQTMKAGSIEHHRPRVPAQLALEVEAGWCFRHNVLPGAVVALA